MKVGEYTFKRRYSAAQIVVDIASVGALLLFVFVISAHIEWADYLNSVNHTDKVLSNDWFPLLVWAVLGVGVFAFSFFLILKNKKLPKKYRVTKHNAVKYCNIIDTCISCVRLMILIILFDVCSTHSTAILFGTFEFPTISVISVLIIAGILVLTKLRVEAVSEAEEAQEENKRKQIVED